VPDFLPAVPHGVACDEPLRLRAGVKDKADLGGCMLGGYDELYRVLTARFGDREVLRICSPGKDPAVQFLLPPLWNSVREAPGAPEPPKEAAP
jgi:hypothetical protein